jgi:DNA-binding transcriptional LysR family regulator
MAMMNKMNHVKALSKIDLNLLMVLQAIEVHRHVSKAAEALGLSQSAVSHALSRLRSTFADDLYVKVPGGMVPTPRANELATQIPPVIESLTQVFGKQKAFVPAELERTFNVLTTDFIEHLLLPGLLQVQNKDAPKIRVSFRNVGFSLPKNELQSGEIDLGIAGFFGDLPDGFYQQKLFSDSFSCCMRKNHPLAAKKMTLKTYCELPHILIAPSGDLSSQVDKILAKNKIKRQIAIGTSGFLAAGWAASRSDAILTAPSKLIEEFENILPLKSFEVPLEIPSITIKQVWHERMNKDAGHKWFREKLFAALNKE